MRISYRKMRVLYRKRCYSYGDRISTGITDKHLFSMTASPRRKSGGFLTVAALLPPRLLLQVRHALGAEREVLAAASWNELERLVKTRPLRAVIVDPANGGVMDSEPVVTLLTRYPSLPIIAYVTLGPATFSGIAQLSRLGL